MNLLGKDWGSVLVSAMAFLPAAAQASDQSWASIDSLDSSTLVSMPEHLSFEQAAANGADQVVGIVPGPDVAAVPEPTTYVLLLVGVGLMAFISLRKR
jgi:hypothetical protein